jgi:uncharacterized protein YkwD
LAHARIALAGGLALLALCAGTLPARANAPASEHMIAHVNKFRTNHGLSPLKQSDALIGSARRYAHWMLANDYFGHQSSIQAAGNFRNLGETLAYHSGWKADVGGTLSQWRHSPSHRAVLLSPAFKYMGAAPSRGRLGSGRVTAWVAQFGG